MFKFPKFSSCLILIAILFIVAMGSMDPGGMEAGSAIISFEVVPVEAVSAEVSQKSTVPEYDINIIPLEIIKDDYGALCYHETYYHLIAILNRGYRVAFKGVFKDRFFVS